MATAPKINCRMLKPRNGIWTSNSITNNALASKTATGAQAERRQASHAANPDGTATLRNSHPAGSVQLEKPKGLSTDTRRGRYSGEELNASRQPTKGDQGLNHNDGPAERIAGADDRGSVSPLTHENSLSFLRCEVPSSTPSACSEPAKDADLAASNGRESRIMPKPVITATVAAMHSPAMP